MIYWLRLERRSQAARELRQLHLATLAAQGDAKAIKTEMDRLRKMLRR